MFIPDYFQYWRPSRFYNCDLNSYYILQDCSLRTYCKRNYCWTDNLLVTSWVIYCCATLLTKQSKGEVFFPTRFKLFKIPFFLGIWFLYYILENVDYQMEWIRNMTKNSYMTSANLDFNVALLLNIIMQIMLIDNVV